MKTAARYMDLCVSLPKQNYPQIPPVSFEEAGISFTEDESVGRFIENCIATGSNADTVFKKPKTITVGDEKLHNVVRYLKNDEFGGHAVVKRGDKYYRSINPVFEGDDDSGFVVGQIVDGTTYSGAKILEHSMSGWYKVGFADGTTDKVHIRSMRKAAVRKNPDMNTEVFADEVADWIKNCGLARAGGGEVKSGESKSGKKYKSVGFSYPRAIDGEIQIFGTSFILVKFNFRGRSGSFTAKSPEEFHSLMTENFGAFIRDY